MIEGKYKIAILGCGNMANAIMEGVCHTKLSDSIEFYFYTPSQNKARDCAEKYSGIHIPNLEKIPSCDYYLIACKPQQFSKLSQTLKEILPSNGVVWSIMAGVKISTIQSLLDHEGVCRLMPNTPCRFNKGTTLLFVKNLNKQQIAFTQEFFATCSEIYNLKTEELIDSLTGISGSGPALLYYFCEAFIHKALEFGLDYSEAQSLVVKTFLGTLVNADQSNLSLSELRNEVTSKKGVTAQALETFSQHKMDNIIGEALNNAFKRAKELGQ